MRIKQLLIASICALASATAAAADWVEQGQGSITYPSGRVEPFKFKFAFLNQGAQTFFYAGEQKVATDQVPPNYILNMIVNRDGEINVAEFAGGNIHGFDLQIGDHRISLQRRTDGGSADNPMSLYRIRIDDQQMLLDTTHPTLMFEFDENGISGINGSGYKKDLSSKSIN